MVLVKVIRDSDGGLVYLRRMCAYVRDGRALAYGGYGVNTHDPDIAYLQMETVRRYYHQTSTNPLIHFIISFDGETDTEAFVKRAAPLIVAYFRGLYQLLWCIHHTDKASAHYHMHLLLHALNLENGKLYHSGYHEVTAFCRHIQRVANM